MINEKLNTDYNSPGEGKKARGSGGNFFMAILDGSFLTRDKSIKNIPFLIFLALLGSLYIANNYNAEKNIRNADKINKEIKELQSEYISLKSELMFRSNQSEVARLASPLGLKESKEPPFKLVVATNKTISDPQ